MKIYFKTIWQIFLVSLWINISESLRWILFSKPHIDKHYNTLNLVLPNEPINNIIWLIWGIIMAAMIFIISKKFTLLQTTFIIWVTVFVMHWFALWNSAVFPAQILWLVIPLSFINVLVGTLISMYFHKKAKI